MKEIIGLHGKAYNGTPYTVNITVEDESVKELTLTGKACKAVSDFIEDFQSSKVKHSTNIIGFIKRSMENHNEYVQTLVR